MSKILTIAVPTYNMEALLERCLDSFLVDNEALEKLEVLVVNDGSKDSSSLIAHRYETRYPQTFKVIDKENGNYGSCINRALKIAQGKYFKICDADDKYDTTALKSFIDFLSEAQSDIVFSPYRVLGPDSNVLSVVETATDYAQGSYDIEYVNWFTPAMIRYRAMHTMSVATHILRNNGYTQTEGISYTDTEFIFYSILYSFTCSFFPQPVYEYFVGRDGQTMSTASILKSHMHFYMNAKRMLDDYVVLPTSIGENKRQLLFRSIMACVHFFAGTSVAHIFHNRKQISLLRGLIEESKTSNVDCPIEEKLLEQLYYRLWRRFHVPSKVLYVLIHMRT
jgi:glycosyltransferase involved in cell wall biosynthesis